MRIRGTALILAILASLAPTPGARADFLVSSSKNNQILRYGDSGAFVGVFNQGGPLMDPEGLARGLDGNIYVSSGTTDQVLRYSGTTGAYLGVAASGNGLSGPLGLVFGPDGSLYVSSYFNNEVLHFNATTGAFLGVAASGGGLNGPDGLGFGPDGNLYVASTRPNTGTGTTPDQVIKYNPTTGASLGVFASGTGTQGFTDLKFGPDGNLYVSAINSSQVLRYNGTTGGFLGSFASGGGLVGPLGLTFGSDNSLYVSGFDSDNVVHYGANGALIGTFITSGEGGLDGPSRSLFVTFNAVPEPSALALTGLGIGGLVAIRRWRRAA